MSEQAIKKCVFNSVLLLPRRSRLSAAPCFSQLFVKSPFFLSHRLERHRAPRLSLDFHYKKKRDPIMESRQCGKQDLNLHELNVH